ncbi:type II toxin-antitoxin system MqsA family antitoxin [Methylomagnum sp.]
MPDLRYFRAGAARQGYGAGFGPHSPPVGHETQAEAAKLAGGGKNAFSRYEHGQAKPVAAVVNLFRLLDRHPELLDELRRGNAA